MPNVTAADLRIVDVACSLCGSTASVPILKKRGTLVPREFTIVKCSQCALVYVNPRIADDDLPKLYDEAYYAGQGFRPDAASYVDVPMTPWLLEGIVDTLEAALGSLQGKRILDVGCGTGELVLALRARGARALGFDSSAAARAICVRRGVPLLEGDPEPGMLDAICAAEVIEHLPDPLAFLSKWKTALRPQGVFMLTTGNWAFVKYGIYVTPEGHICYYTPLTLRTLFMRAGLTSRTDVFNRTWLAWRVLPRAVRANKFALAVVTLLARSVSAWVPQFGPFPIGIA